MSEWFLIPKEVVSRIQKTLNSLISADRIFSDDEMKDLLHEFETSLHKTAVIPKDFNNEEREVA